MSEVTLTYKPMPELKHDITPFVLSGLQFEEDHSLTYEEAMALFDSAGAALDAYCAARRSGS